MVAPIGVVTGLAVEADAIRRLPDADSLEVALSAANSAAAERAAAALVANGARALVSFGLAAGLSPLLGPGGIIIADRVIPRDGPIAVAAAGGVRDQMNQLFTVRRPDAALPDQPILEDDGVAGAAIPTDAAALAALREAIAGRVVEGAVIGLDRPVMTMAQKLKLFAETGAVAADMESAAVARAAQSAGLPFAVLRAVSDPSNRSIPRAALASVMPDGSVSVGPVVRGLIVRPWELLDVAALAIDSRLALGRLRRVARDAFPRLLALL